MSPIGPRTPCRRNKRRSRSPTPHGLAVHHIRGRRRRPPQPGPSNTCPHPRPPPRAAAGPPPQPPPTTTALSTLSRIDPLTQFLAQGNEIFRLPARRPSGLAVAAAPRKSAVPVVDRSGGPAVQPLTAEEIRSSFVNSSRSLVKAMTLPATSTPSPGTAWTTSAGATRRPRPAATSSYAGTTA